MMLEIKDKITPETDKNLNHAIKEMIDGLNEGKVSIVEKQGNEWKVNGWVQKGILLFLGLIKEKLLVDLTMPGTILNTCQEKQQDGQKKNLRKQVSG